jgi:glycosyltransferase involved in cell wall biosynthesis
MALNLKPTFVYQMGYNTFLGYFINKFYGIPLVYRLFGTTVWDQLSKNSLKLTLYQRILFFPVLFILKHPGDLIVMSNDGTRGDKVMDFFGVPSKKSLFLLNGLDPPLGTSTMKLRENIPKNFFLLATAARLVKWKGIDRIVRAMPEIIKRIPDLRLVIIGDGQERNALENLAVSQGVFDKIHFIGQIRQAEVIDTLKQADIYISTQYISNLSNCLLEAIISELPIISVADGSLSGFLEDGKDVALLDPDKVENELPLVVERIVKDRVLYKKLKDGVKEKRKEIWSWAERISYELDVIEAKINQKS